GDGGRALADRLLQLEGLGPARQADLDEHAAGNAIGLVVGEPVRALDHDLMVHATRVRQARDLGRIIAGDARRRLQYQPGAGARGDEGRLRAEQAGDGGAGRLVQLVEV